MKDQWLVWRCAPRVRAAPARLPLALRSVATAGALSLMMPRPRWQRRRPVSAMCCLPAAQGVAEDVGGREGSRARVKKEGNWRAGRQSRTRGNGGRLCRRDLFTVVGVVRRACYG